MEDIVDTPRTSKYIRTLRSVAWMLHWHKSIKNTQTMLTSEELAMCKEGDPETGTKEVFLEGVEDTGKWPASSAPV